MNHKRLHIRIPIIGNVLLSKKSGPIVQAHTIDISAAGIRVGLPTSEFDDTEYDVEVITYGRKTVRFTAVLVHSNDEMAGFKIVHIDPANLKTLYLLINDFQATEEFIHYVDNLDILSDWLVNETGETVDVTFEINPKLEKRPELAVC